MATEPNPPGRPPRLGYAWYVVGVLMLAYVCSFVDRQILALLVPPIQRDLGISDTKMSLLLGLSFALFYSFLGLPIGRLADRHNRKGIIAIGIAVWSIMTALSGAARNYWQLFLARMGVGVGEAALSPPAYSIIADYFPRERLGTAIGVYSLGIFLGSGLALMLGGWIAGEVAATPSMTVPLLGEVRSWQAVFFMVGIPGLLIALWVATLKEPVRGGLAASAAQPPALPLREITDYVRKYRRAFLGHNLGFAFISMVNYAWAYWVPTWLQRVHGWDARHTGLVYGLWTATFGVAGVVMGGWLGDRLARRGYADAKIRVGLIAVVGEMVTGIFFLTAPTASMEWALIPSTFFASFGFGAAAAAIQEISPGPMRAQTSALYLFMINLIGQWLGPLFVARLTDGVFHDQLMIGRSILIVTVGGLIAAGVTFATTLRPFREAVAACQAWRPKEGAVASG